MINLLGSFIPTALRDTAYRLAGWAHPVIYMADLYLLQVLSCLIKTHNERSNIRDQGIRICLIGYWKGRNVLNYIYAGGAWNIFLWIIIRLSTSVSFCTPKDKKKQQVTEVPAGAEKLIPTGAAAKALLGNLNNHQGPKVHQLKPHLQ